MKLRISSLGPVALLASSMMLAFGAQAASADQGIVIYNAQHENLVKSSGRRVYQRHRHQGHAAQRRRQRAGQSAGARRRRFACRRLPDGKLPGDGVGG